jgi:hypothetical protein
MKGFLLEVVTIPKATRWTEVAGRIQSGLWPTADLNGLTSVEVRSGSFSTKPASPADHSMSALARKQLVLVRTRNGAKCHNRP